MNGTDSADIMTAPDPLTSESPSIMDSFVDPRNRFDAIERDAASLLISETDTSMSTTVHGLGAFSGRAIMRMGEYTLRGITGVVIKWKLSDISAKIQRKDPQDWPPGLLDHVLELQRCAPWLYFGFMSVMLHAGSYCIPTPVGATLGTSFSSLWRRSIGNH